MNINLLNEAQIDYIVNFQEAKYHDLGWLWTALDSLEKFPDKIANLNENFSTKKDIFFVLLEYLMLNNELKLAKNNEILRIEPSIILSEFQSIFPKSEEDVQELGGVQIWLVMNSDEYCPFWPIWVDTDVNGKEKLWWAD
ncbi:DUF596 domain-containing protein [Acinetobacter radioresistens]|uniref:DUF596 domain-containing protein n=1 Tax=Acinetobacter radioresistens TaxID=40216 RepID=UPI0020068D59|nr:DUF596 domain-containing protein [Acinetobacter radioresistens]MCK4106608.1 DUF596 domain-containing protein [Acinetobacter radioresistens]